MTTIAACATDQLGYLVRLARAELAALYGQPAPAADDPGGWSAGFVNVTLRRGGLLYGSMGAARSRLPDAVREAVARAANDTRFGRRLMAADLGTTRIEVWIELEREKIDAEDAVEWGKLRLGWDGVHLRLGDAHAYYKPSVAITSAAPSAQALLERLSRKAGLPDAAWSELEAELERTTWIHALESPQQPEGFVVLESLRPVAEQAAVTPAEIGAAAQRSLARMLATQRADGTLGYWYDPFSDTWDAGSSQVRLAGCAYSLARAADHPALADGAVDAATALLLGYLKRQMVSLDDGATLFVREDDAQATWGRLGASALAALALQSTAGRRHPREAQGLIDGLIAAQKPDGSFVCTIGRADTNPRSQLYFPGESLLALAHYARRTGDERAARCVSRAFEYYRAYFDDAPHASFIVWQADAWARVAGWRQDGTFPPLGPNAPSVDELARFVFDQTDWLLPRQFRSGHPCPRQYVGGFSVPEPPTFSSAAFLEAVIRACDLAWLVGDAERCERYRAASLSGLGFILRLQVPAELAPFFPRPELALGATTASLESFRMRCDFDQHFLTACITALESPALWR